MLRFRQGLSPAVDVHQQHQQVAVTEGLLALVDGQEAVLRQQLALLLGALPPAELAEDRVDLPSVPAPPARPVPASLLESRPDLRAAQRRVESADRRVGAAVAARLPALMLSFSPGYRWQRSKRQATAAIPLGGTSTVDGFIWNANATLSVPLFDGLRGRGVVDQQDAVLEERLVAYERIVLGALVEVETALALERQQHVYVTQLTSQLEIANETLLASQDRYRAGLSDFLPVLTALRAQQAIELEHLAARRALLSYRIQLHRAIGGRLPDSFATEPAEGGGDVEAP
jgi:outer membrane protein TolC